MIDQDTIDDINELELDQHRQGEDLDTEMDLFFGAK